MQTLNRPKNGSEFQTAYTLNEKPRRNYPSWPIFVIIAVSFVTIKLISSAFGPSGVLITTGIGSILLTLYIALRMSQGLNSLNSKSRRLFILTWSVISLIFGISFIISGIGYAAIGKAGMELAKTDLRRTIFSAGLFGMWLVGVVTLRYLRNSKALFLILWTATTFETIKLIVAKEHPTFISYIIWLATGLIAGMAIVHSPHGKRYPKHLRTTSDSATRKPRSGKSTIVMIDDESRSLAMRDPD